MSAEAGRGRRGSRACALRLCLAIGFLLNACASSGPEFGDNHRARYHRGQPSYKVGAAYQINGVWYHPRVDYDYDETGLASWYGEAFDGQATANGEIYDLNQLSAAHKTLPVPGGGEGTTQRHGRPLPLLATDRRPRAFRRWAPASLAVADLTGSCRGRAYAGIGRRIRQDLCTGGCVCDAGERAARPLADRLAGQYPSRPSRGEWNPALPG